MAKKQQHDYLPDDMTKTFALATGTLGAMALGLAALAGTMVYTAAQNHDDMTATRDLLDTSAAHVFNSVADCAQNYGYSAAECEASQKKRCALPGTTARYFPITAPKPARQNTHPAINTKIGAIHLPIFPITNTSPKSRAGRPKKTIFKPPCRYIKARRKERPRAMTARHSLWELRRNRRIYLILLNESLYQFE